MRLVNSLLPAWTISWNWKFLFVHGSTGFTPWWRLREAWKRSTGISRVFHQSGPIISHTLQSGLYFTVICLDSKGFHLSVLEGTYCFMRKKKAVKRVLLEKNLIKTENKNGLSKNVPSEWMQFLCRFDLLVPVAWLSPGIPLRRTSKRTS